LLVVLAAVIRDGLIGVRTSRATQSQYLTIMGLFVILSI
jgi:hypothetical protein